MSLYPLGASPSILLGDKCHALTNKKTPCKLAAECDNIYCYKHAPCYKYERPETCAICTETIGLDVKPTKCGHFMHDKCLKTWLKSNNTCPMCREHIRSQKGGSFIRLELNPDQQIAFEDLMNAFRVLVQQCREQDILQE